MNGRIKRTTINRVLVANRGEIARRVFRTCRDLGIGTVAVHSDADAAMPFVSDADVAIRLPGNTSAETYLRSDLIIEAAVRAGADAIHPGYGFLSENSDFARAVIDAGLIWIGPHPSSIDQMGSKVEAKKLMTRAGVPVLRRVKPERVTEEDLPLLVKASAGGGGRGMRIIRDPGDLENLDEVLEAARSEAESAFGDGTVFLEPYIDGGRHVEVQIMGTAHGVAVLGERDCSVQRRHQKVIEEAPAPGISDLTRRHLHDSARKAAEAINYVGAGTVEFLYDPDRDDFYFLEMNTRLQVEHPVTESVIGLDLVAMQIAVAEGRHPSGVNAVGANPAGAPEPQGHSVEVRLYAEDPATDYQPQSGVLTAFEIPGVISEFSIPQSSGLRLDSGVRVGDEVGTFYDAMIAKVISWAPSRDQALRQLAGALERARIHGLRTNRDLLVNLLRDPVVADGRMHTGWLDGADVEQLAALTGGDEARKLSPLAATVAVAEISRLNAVVQTRIPAGFRNVVAEPLITSFTDRHEERIDVRWHGGNRKTFPDHPEVEVIEVSADTAGSATVTLEVDGLTRRFHVSIHDGDVDVDSSLGHVALRRLPRFVDPTKQVQAGSLLAPMPGAIVGVDVAVGQVVSEGQVLMVMEAMKMQHKIAAPHDGTVTELTAAVGDQVDAGTVLAIVEADSTSDDESSESADQSGEDA